MNYDQQLDVEYGGRENSHDNPLHYVILGTVAGRTAVIADTLNCHYLIEPDEQREWLQRLIHRHNVHNDLRAALREAIEFQDDDTDCLMGRNPEPDEDCVDGRCKGHGCMVMRVNRWRNALTKATGGAS